MPCPSEWRIGSRRRLASFPTFLRRELRGCRVVARRRDGCHTVL
jgi:hypothetical protein